MNQTHSKIPSIGDGATIYSGSDRLAGTIIDVLRDGKLILIQIDKATRTDSNGMSEIQSYAYVKDSNGIIIEASLRKDNSFKEIKNNNKVLIGIRDKYYNFSF